MILLAMPPESTCQSRRPAFTLVELLVVMGVIAVLTSILLPALSSARATARQTAELAAGHQLGTAYALYSQDHRGNLMVGYATAAMTDPNTPEGQALVVHNEHGERMHGVEARRYPWRLAPYLDYNFAGLYKDPRLLERYRARLDYQYVISLSPSYGLNSTFFGGDADRFGFNRQALGAWGSFYATREDQPQRPHDLVLFATAYGVNPDGGESVPGYFRVDAPRSTSGSWSTTLAAARELEASQRPAGTGHVDFRHGGRAGEGKKAAVIMFDGHGSALGFEQMRDMRRWSDKATGPDWSVAD